MDKSTNPTMSKFEHQELVKALSNPSMLIGILETSMVTTQLVAEFKASSDRQFDILRLKMLEARIALSNAEVELSKYCQKRLEVSF